MTQEFGCHWDVNGDSVNDLILGAVGGDGSNNYGQENGESYVVFGKASLPTTIDVSNLGTNGVTIFGAQPQKQSGDSVSCAGDLNGAGFDDLVIGAWNADVSELSKIEVASTSFVESL